MFENVLRLAEMRTLAAILLACIMQGCLASPSAIETPYEMSDETRAEFWRQAEHRVYVWFQGNPPELPPSGDVWAATRWVLVPPGSLDPPTCDFSPGSFRVRVQTDVVGGCEAHELLHAALRMVEHPCSSIVEHEVPAPARCLGAEHWRGDSYAWRDRAI